MFFMKYDFIVVRSNIFLCSSTLQMLATEVLLEERLKIAAIICSCLATHCRSKISNILSLI